MSKPANNNSNSHSKQYTNTQQFENVLKKALELQEGMCKALEFPRVSKSSRSFKEIAETVLAQLEYLKKNPKNHQSSQKYIGDDGEITTTGTQLGDELEQLHEILREKDQIIDMLGKEKNYYAKKTEMLSKQCNVQSQSSMRNDEQNSKLDQAKASIQSQKDLILKQQEYINDLELRVQAKNQEIFDLQSQIKELDKQLQSQIIASQYKSNLTSNRIPQNDNNRQNTAQAKMVEELVRKNHQLQQDLIRFKENGSGNGLFAGNNLQMEDDIQSSTATSLKLVKSLVNEIIALSQNSTQAEIIAEEQLQDLKQQLQMLKRTSYPKKENTFSSLSPQFSSLLSLKQLEQISKEFYKGGSMMEQIENKNSQFKELSQQIEDSIFKFHEIYLSYQAYKQKINKYEETFQQLDKVFSQENSEEDGKVLEQLRHIGNSYLNQIFEMQRELAQYQSLENLPTGIMKILKKAYQKSSRKGNNNNAVSDDQSECYGNDQGIEEENIFKDQQQQQTQKKSVKGKNRNNKGQSNSHLSSTQQRPFKSQDRIPTMSNLQQLNGSTNYHEQQLNFLECQENLNKALDKIFELEQQKDNLEKELTLNQLEFKKLKEEFDKGQQEKKQLEQKIQDFEKQFKLVEQEKNSLQIDIQEKEQELEKMDKEVGIQSDKAKKIAQLNEELRGLIEQERNAYNEERQKLESEMALVQKQYDAKIKLVKNKLLLLLSNDTEKQVESFDGNSATNNSIEEIVKRIQDYVNFLKKNQNGGVNASFVQSKENIYVKTLGSSNGKHQRLPSNTSYVLSENHNNNIAASKGKDVSPLKQQLVNIFGKKGGQQQLQQFQQQQQQLVNAQNEEVLSYNQSNFSGCFRQDTSQFGFDDDRTASPDRFQFFKGKDQQIKSNMSSVPLRHGQIISNTDEDYYAKPTMLGAGEGIVEYSDNKLKKNPHYNNITNQTNQLHYAPNLQIQTNDSINQDNYNNINNSQFFYQQSYHDGVSGSIPQLNQKTPNLGQNVVNLNMYASESGFRELSNQLEMSQIKAKPNGTKSGYYYQQTPTIEPTQQYDDHTDKKKSINDILSNFKKEKEQFNEKLLQLRSKLQTVQSPDQSTKLDQNEIINNGVGNSNEYVMSPVIENRRAKTLQKLNKHLMGQSNLQKQDQKIRPFCLLNNCK